eukprot:g35737.t1
MLYQPKVFIRARHDAEHFFCHLRPCAHFFGQESTPRRTDPFAQFQHSPSIWIPPFGLLPALNLRVFLEQRPELSPTTTTLLRLAKLILTVNNFAFNSSHFLQVRRLAMGTCIGPSYACLFMGYVEHSLFQSYS